jgi:hypothetical protein
VLDDKGEVVGVAFAIERATADGLVIPVDTLRVAQQNAVFTSAQPTPCATAVPTTTTVASSLTPPPTGTPTIGLPTYPVTADLNLRSGPSSTSASLGVIPNGTTLGVVCYTNGERVNGPYGATAIWDLVEWNGETGYVTDEYVDTKSDIGSVIRPCE